MSVMNAFAVGILLVHSVIVVGAVETLGHANLRSDHVAATNQERRAQESSDFVTYYCVPPEGKISENWDPDSTSHTGESCYNNIYTCCGPLQNIANCPVDYPYAWPGAWSNGVCKGYSAHDCCYIENGYTQWVFPTCFDTHVKILDNWVNDTCTKPYYRNCCAESLAPSPSAPTVTPPTFSGSRSAPTSRPVYRPAPSYRQSPISRSSSSSDSNGALIGGMVAVLLVGLVIVICICFCLAKKPPSSGTTTPNLPENNITSSATSAGTSSPSATVQSKPSAASDHTTSESTTESSNSGESGSQVEQLAAKIKESIHNSGGAALSVEQISALLKESIPNAGAAAAAAATTTDEGGGIQHLATLVNVVSALNDVTGTVENVTESANNIAGIASLFQL